MAGKVSLRVLLVLGRVSNLPTVWSNCLAAWWLAGGGRPRQFVLVCTGATLLYTGGMYLNDAFDVEFDRQYRPERPIALGQISTAAVWLIAAALLVLGWLAIVPLGKLPAMAASMLLATIIIYNAVHKHTVLAPLLMAACRFLVYVVAAAAAIHGIRSPVVVRACALAAYIVGLSYLARNESTGRVTGRWSIPLLFAPIVAFIAGSPDGLAVWFAAAAQGVWVFWCLRGGNSRAKRYLSSGVAGLLAGIVLVDWLAAAASPAPLRVAFLGLFLLALVSQRFAPAT